MDLFVLLVHSEMPERVNSISFVVLVVHRVRPTAGLNAPNFQDFLCATGTTGNNACGAVGANCSLRP